MNPTVRVSTDHPLPPARRFALAAALATGLLLGAPLCAQTGVNLLMNPGFGTGTLAPWTVVSGGAGLGNYGASGLPGNGVSAIIGGGGLMLRDLNNGVVEQVVQYGSAPAGASLVVEGYLGGGPEDTAQIVVHFRNAAGTTLSVYNGQPVSVVERNFESVLLYRRTVVPVDPNADRFAVRVVFGNGCCNGNFAAADELSATIVTGSTLPSPWPLNTELLANPGFEGGWSATSPLTLVDERGWEGVGASSCSVRAYSNSNAAVPPGIVSCAIAGAAPNPSCVGGAAGSLLAHDGSSSALRQRIDLRSNPVQTANVLVVHASAFLGGSIPEDDFAQVEFRCVNANGTPLSTGLLSPVTAAQRNYEPVLLLREADVPVIPGTVALEVIVSFGNNCCNGTYGLIDNISARLLPAAPRTPISLNTNLLSNGGFENGTVPGSAFELSNANGWIGGPSNQNRCGVVTYGGAQTPSTTFASNNALGGELLQDGTNSALRQIVDLRGSQPLVQSGHLAMQASAWLGGYANEPDTAEVHISFVDASLNATGLLQVLPPVTSTERANQTTLLQRVGAPFAVPANAAFAIVDLLFVNGCCNGAHGMADDIRLVAFDTTVQTTASPYPGTGGDFVLLTGIDELPRTGIGNYVKTAHAGNVLRTVVGSPNGTVNGAPVVLALNLFPTGGALPNPFLPQFAIDPFSALLVYYGLSGGLFAPVVLPFAQGGNVWNQVLPPGLAGTSVLLQALCLPPNAMPALYLTTAGHEIRVQ